MYLINPESKGCLEKAKTPKVASNLASFYGSHIDEIICVKHIGSGSAMTIREY